nr:hypothetical protein [Desulfobulbaceae bacterium]
MRLSIPKSFYLTTLSLVLLLTSYSYAGTYADSAHGDTTNGVTGRTTGFVVGNCAHCHDQHASRVNVPSTPNNSLRGLSEENLCEDCHGVGGPAKNIQSVIDKTYGHTYLDDVGYSGRHTTSKLELETASTGSTFPGTNRHVECSDCHEPHTAQTGNHTVFTDGNAVSNALSGVWGVEPITDVAWVPATTYTETDPATKEYQICFKCHSYYAFQDADGITALTGPSGVTITDQSMEFSKGNKSAHPVRVGLSSQTGSYAPKNLATSRMVAPWNTSGGSGVGNQTMYCSDCHGNDAATPVGPHGSANPNMIKGTTNYEWPYNVTRGRLWTLADVYYNLHNVGTELLCKKCHSMEVVWDAGESKNIFRNYAHEKHYRRDFKANPWASAYPKYGTGGGESQTDAGYPCITCHIIVPHGSKRSRLIGYESDAAPYSLDEGGGLVWPVVWGFKKVTDPFDDTTKDCSTGYDKGSCYANTTACSTKHDANPGTDCIGGGPVTFDP